MKRSEIRLAVDMALAENGYSQGWYAWKGAYLIITSRMLDATKIHLPAGKTSRKRLIERLSALPAAGPPRALKHYSSGAKDDGFSQLDIEDAIRGAR